MPTAGICPGGGVEAGETLLEALARELREEGNIELTGPPALHGVFFHPLYSRRDHVTVYVVREFRQTAPPVPNHEIVAHGFFPLDALPADTTAGTRARIAEVLHGQAATERWWSGVSRMRCSVSAANGAPLIRDVAGVATVPGLRARSALRAVALRCAGHECSVQLTNRSRSCGAAKSSSGPSGTMPVGFTLRWLP